MDFSKFNWGNIPKDYIEYFKNDSTTAYTKIFQVEENDIVVDIGACVGSFTYSILDKNPEHCWVIEPVMGNFKTLYQNLKHNQVSFISAAISDEKEIENSWYDSANISKGITFKYFIENYCIDRIDFLKTDCEGCEYLIFTDENLEYIKNNVKKIVGEFHLDSTDKKEKFRYFRDYILTQFEKYYIYSVDDIDIKWDLFNEHFIEYYNHIIIHIDNR